MANGNNDVNRRITRGIYTGDELPVILRREVFGWGTVEGEVILPDVTHLTVDRSITVIPEQRFYAHRNIVELICHEHVKKIEYGAFHRCPRLRRVVMSGVEEVGLLAFIGCRSVSHVECIKLERVRKCAFDGCVSLRGIDLPSARIVEGDAFLDCETMEVVTFGKDLESIRSGAFLGCRSLKRITIPLKNRLFPNDDTFQECDNLSHVTLVEEKELNETVNALLLQDWRNEMRRVIDSINHDLPNAPAGDDDRDDYGVKSVMIRSWVESVLSKIIRYKAQHCSLLNEVVTSTLENVLPNDIVLDSVLPFLELPPYTFNGEEDEGAE